MLLLFSSLIYDFSARRMGRPMNEIERSVQSRLFEMADEKYREFHARLMPTIEHERVIGVRTPALRAYAKEFAKTHDADVFMQALPHKYYEENNLHAFLIEQIKDYDLCITAIDEFLPYIDNWATCDMMRPKVLKKHPARTLEKAKEWMAGSDTYTIRFGIEILMCFFLDRDFEPEYLDLAAALRSDEYYVNMMIAWFFATALAKQYDAALPFIEQRKLDRWTHNKAIQKAVESYRVTDGHKEYLRSLKIKD